MQAIRTTISAQKEKRNAEIKAAYKVLMSIEGSQRTAVAEQVASQLGVNYSLVMRITKSE
jgi:hypothetical protein